VNKTTLPKVHLSDAQLPEYASKEHAAAAAESAPLISADGTVTGTAAIAAAAKPLGVFSDMSSSGLIQCVTLNQQALIDAKDVLQVM